MDGKRFKQQGPEAETRFGASVQQTAGKPGDWPPGTRDLLMRYGVALGLAGLALFLRGVLPFREGTAIYQLPLVAVLLSAWYGGRGPGLLASAICITGVWYWFIPPARSFEISPDHVLPFSIFIALCLLVTQFSAGRRRAEQALRASEERFRALVQFSFDVYWETDARTVLRARNSPSGSATDRSPAPRSARLAGKCRTSSRTKTAGASTARRWKRTCRSATSSSRVRRRTGASATCPFPESRRSTKSGASWATAASGGTSPSASAPRPSTGQHV